MEIPKEKNEKVIDADLEKAQKSMGDRMDPDDTTPPEATPAPKDPEKDITPPATPLEEKKADDMPPPPPENKTPKRPEAYIPLPKYLSEKAEHDRILADKDIKLAEALKQVEELKSIANTGDGVQKDDDIEAFMDKTGFSRDVVEGLLDLATKRILKPEQMEALNKTTTEVKEAEIEAAYNTEFDSIALPDLKKRFPNATDEQIKKAKTQIDQIAHTTAFHDKGLDFIIFKHLDDISTIFTDAPEAKDETPPVTKKTIESSRLGAGKNTPLTAKEFEGKTDFSELNDMDPSERSLLIRDFSIKTYENFKAWVNQSEKQVTEVMRDGKKVILK